MKTTLLLVALLAIGAAGCDKKDTTPAPSNTPKVEAPRPPEAPTAAAASGAPATASTAPATASPTAEPKKDDAKK